MAASFEFKNKNGSRRIGSQLKESLPPVKPIKVSSEPEYYGAICEIADSTGCSLVGKPRGTWRHGVSLTESYEFPEEIVANHSREVVHLVHSKDQELFLRRKGYPLAFSVGAPYLYAKEIPADRVEDSTLVMLPHSTKHSHHLANEEKLLVEIDTSIPPAGDVWYCISRTCVENGNWVDSLENKQRNIVVGAEVHDGFSLRRMKFLFRIFGRVVSPGLGSHLFYAQASGAEVSLIPSSLPQFEQKKMKELAKEPFYRQYPWVLEKRNKESRESQYQVWSEDLSGQLRQKYVDRKLGVQFVKDGRYVGDMLNCFEGMNFRARFDKYRSMGPAGLARGFKRRIFDSF